MVQDLRRLFDIVGAYRVDLVGYSMGAIVSLITAGQDPRIRRLVVGGIGAMVVELGGVDNRVRVVPGTAIVAALQAQDPGTITNQVAAAFRSLADRVGADREALAAHVSSERTGQILFNKITARPLEKCLGDDEVLDIIMNV